MIDRLDEGLHRLKVPIPDSSLGWLNAYLIRGEDRFLLIDTGMNRPECERPLRESLEELDVDRSKLDFFVTHGHVDHTGLVSELKTPGSRLFAHPEAAALIRFEDWGELLEFGKRHGFDDTFLQGLLEHHPGTRWGPSDRLTLEFEELYDGDTLTYGDYHLRVVSTPGHAAGHLCLYEPDRGYLFSGDHLLRDITPNISSWSRKHSNRLGQYLDSLDRVAELEVKRVLPAHRSLFEDHRVRVRELHEHHEARLNEALALLEGGPLSGYELASRMKWDLDTSDWEAFHPVQKWFAVGEAVAHLVMLEKRGEVRRVAEGEIDRYEHV